MKNDKFLWFFHINFWCSSSKNEPHAAAEASHEYSSIIHSGNLNFLPKNEKKKEKNFYNKNSVKEKVSCRDGRDAQDADIQV